MKEIPLGFEVGTGKPVSLPLRHMAITGQTQEAGKTTTLEALIQRSGLRAVSFITKRGEGSFEHARRIPPYFEEQADWQYVASILEASRGEKLRFERAWIIRASKGARTLADVQRNVRAAMEKARGLSADVYLTLDAYLDQVVPTIASVKWARELLLEPGVNAMDLGGLPMEMQHLVIRSAMTWVLKREWNTVVVVPEAWKFIPQGRGTPVKLAAEAYVRQGAALGNYLWLDSQDIGGIDKTILRSVAVWLLGVQREANEIKRTLDNIPAIPVKPKPSDIATLQLGEFFACWGTHKAKTYVQPAWMSTEEAAVRAMGKLHGKGTFEAVGTVLERFVKGGAAAQAAADREIARVREEDPAMCEQHQKLERELANKTTYLEEAKREATALRSRAEKAEERMRRAEGLSAAAEALGAALARLLPAGAGGPGAPVDEDAIVQRVLARIPAGGAGPITVTAPEALRLQVQKDVAQRVVAAARELPPIAKRLLKVLVALDKRISQRAAAERAGVSWGGSVMEAFKALSGADFIDAHPSGGTKASVRERIAKELVDLGAKEEDIEATYQAVLYELAMEAAAA